jgi:hypothetical protein
MSVENPGLIILTERAEGKQVNIKYYQDINSNSVIKGFFSSQI